ncbi:MAG: hypothetical protein LC792_15035 [Actinobacteria bacterium]|nr:hypothetical protein [Actinomycetota bacterium]
MSGPVAWVCDYAATHGLDPADLMTVIDNDPEPEPALAATAVYGDALYETAYLDLVAEGLASEEDQ